MSSESGDRRPHALVVGGSGMLRPVVLYLAQQGYCVSVIARNHRRLEAMATETLSLTGGVNPLAVDYTDTPALEARLRGVINEHGPLEIVVSWIHTSQTLDAPGSIALIASETAGGKAVNFFHIQSSSAADPARDASRFGAAIKLFDNIEYHSVILGFKVEDQSSRWLTDGEIADGVITAIQGDRSESVVGTVEPWAKRP